MLAYHFVPAQYGLSDLHHRRLKVATLHDLNDPFELFGVDLSNPEVRHAFGHLKERLAKTRGLLCFSRYWSNPVQWSHYADRHRGLCLGVEVEDVVPIEYTRTRLVREAEAMTSGKAPDDETVSRFLRTKYSHWRYESEVRCFVALEDRDNQTGLYFIPFGPRLKLRKVIVGAESKLSRAEVTDALGNLAEQVEIVKARLAFNTFRVVRQRDQGAWR